MNYQAFLDVLPRALEGWAGVFIVLAVIAISVMILNLAGAKGKDE